MRKVSLYNHTLINYIIIRIFVYFFFAVIVGFGGGDLNDHSDDDTKNLFA